MDNSNHVKSITVLLKTITIIDLTIAQVPIYLTVELIHMNVTTVMLLGLVAASK
jgi:hypothetical protein